MATPKKGSTEKPATTKSSADSGLAKKVENLQEAVRRLASGAVVTEEHRNAILDLLSGGK